MVETVVLEFTCEKETKTFVRFSEALKPGRTPITGKLYISKHFADGADHLTVTIEKRAKLDKKSRDRQATGLSPSRRSIRERPYALGSS